MRAHDTGIITERDALRAVAAHGAEALARPVGAFASKPLVAVQAAGFVYRALSLMSRFNFRHLGVEDENGELCGIVTSRDLLRLRAQEATILGDSLDRADDVPTLAAAWARLPQAVGALLAEEVSGRDIAAVISRELCALTRRAGVLAERRMKEEGQGDTPCPYALCVLGSGGRDESMLAMDQDNAIVFAEGEPGGTADLWFARLGGMVADILHEVGVPYCEGGVMGRNEQWRGSLATWRARVSDWITRSKPEDLLSVDIFFDLVGVHGDPALAQELWRGGFDAAQGNAAFAKLLADAPGGMPPGLNFFGGLRAQNGRIDLKLVGLFGIVSTARVLAVRYHLLERSTPARLAAAAALGRGWPRPRCAGARASAVPRSHPRSADRRRERRPAAEQQGRGQAADPPAAPGLARGARRRTPSRHAHARSAFLNSCRDLTERPARGIDRVPCHHHPSAWKPSAASPRRWPSRPSAAPLSVCSGCPPAGCRGRS